MPNTRVDSPLQPDADRVLAAAIRMRILEMVHRANASHVGSALSMADVLATLYGSILRYKIDDPAWIDRDRLILSKGHGAAGLYAVLAECGFFPKAWLNDYSRDGSILMGHASHYVPGVELSTGSLGHGLPVACGMALAAKSDGRSYRVYTVLSDGELDEGSNWESILFGPQHQLDNLIVIVDYNKIQSYGTVREVLDLEPMVDKWRAFRWAVQEIDGHDCAQIKNVLNSIPFEPGKPSVIIAHTIKGKGVSFMENDLLWHYRSPNAEQVAQALSEVEISE